MLAARPQTLPGGGRWSKQGHWALANRRCSAPRNSGSTKRVGSDSLYQELLQLEAR